MNSNRPGNDFRTFSGLHTTHGPNPQLLKGLVSQSTRIVLPHVDDVGTEDSLTAGRWPARSICCAQMTSSGRASFATT